MKKILISLFCLTIFGNCSIFGAGKIKDNKLPAFLEDIFTLASLAPSSHNAQMWKVKIISSNEFLILLDKSRTLPASDPSNKEAFISLGGFIENLVQGAKKYNFDAAVIIPDEIQNDNIIARILLKEKVFTNIGKSLESIEERLSIKTQYKKIPLKGKHLDEFLSISNRVKYFPLESFGGNYIKDSMYQAYIKEAYNKEAQKEMSKWIITSNKEAKERKDGIRAEQMGITGLKKFIYYAFINEKSLETKKFIEPGIKKTKEQVENCSGYIVLTSPSDKLTDLIETGRIMQRLWLKATELKVAIHPMSQILHEAPWKNEVTQKLKLNESVKLVLRVGYVEEYGKPNSLRRNIYEFIEH